MEPTQDVQIELKGLRERALELQTLLDRTKGEYAADLRKQVDLETTIEILRGRLSEQRDQLAELAPLRGMVRLLDGSPAPDRLAGRLMAYLIRRKE